MKDGIVTIHGKQYKTVAKRIDEFRTEHKTDLSVVTQLIEQNDELVIMKAEILDKDGRIIATGYAEEKRGASMINETSALENCETSAIGRALANFGLGGGEYASADEVANAISQQNERKGGKVDFAEVRAKLALIDTIEDLEGFRQSLNCSESQWKYLQPAFTKRKEMINGSAD